MVSDADILAGIPQKTFISLPSKAEKYEVKSPETVAPSQLKESKTTEPISTLPELIGLDPDMVLDELKKERKTKKNNLY